MTFNIDWGYTLSVVFVGLFVVFAVLIILVLICMLMGKFFESIDKKKNGGNGSSDKKAEPVKSAPAQKAAPIIKATGIPNEVVAAISAAVATIMGTDNGFSIKSIKRSNTGKKGGIRSAWRNAGIAENTRPF